MNYRQLSGAHTVYFKRLETPKLPKFCRDLSNPASSSRLPAILLMGPTASGKTQLAMDLVSALPCEIVSVDSAMVYRGMDIGTAKPDNKVRAVAPHRLIDILDPAQSYSAASFRDDALREMTDILANGKIPLLVGGTMLYYRALQQGLSRLPPADPKVRAQITAQARSVGWFALHKRLQMIDPVAARRIHPNDPQRVQRALEVYELTGIPLTTHYACGHHQPTPFRFIKFALMPAEREELRERIEHRFRQMLEQGLITEVMTLYKRKDLSPNLPSMRAVGYRQVWSYLEGQIDYATMVKTAIAATRQLAKRQLTWLRAEQGTDLLRSDELSLTQLVKKITYYVNRPSC